MRDFALVVRFVFGDTREEFALALHCIASWCACVFGLVWVVVFVVLWCGGAMVRCMRAVSVGLVVVVCALCALCCRCRVVVVSYLRWV